MKNILVLTQCFCCGSWISIEKILNNLPRHLFGITVIGLGPIKERNSHFRYIRVPYPEFNRYGSITCKSPVFNFLWNLPLIILGNFFVLLKRPRAVYYNGLATGLIMSPFTKLLGVKNVIMYHTFLGRIGLNKSRLLGFFAKSVDIFVVNSSGSAKDVAQFADSRKIVINEHYAEDVFFKTNIKSTGFKNDNFCVSYVGRIDEDKLCFPLIEAISVLGEVCGIEFKFAGGGSAISRVVDLSKKYRNVHYLGYIDSRKKLADFYSSSDVLWTTGNETYLCLPAIESLACGTPIIVPKESEVRDTDGRRKIVDPSLVPSKIGWLIDVNDVRKIADTLLNIKEAKVSMSQRLACRRYADEHYSIKNISKVVSRLESLHEK